MSKLLHTAMAVVIAILVLGFMLLIWSYSPKYLGAMAASWYFVGREIAQAEYRWIEHHGLGRRANMRWNSIFTTPGIWDTKSWFWDMTLPAVVVFGLTVLLPT